MYLSLYVSMQNEVKRIVFTKPLYAVSLYGYFAALFGSPCCLCFILLSVLLYCVLIFHKHL